MTLALTFILLGQTPGAFINGTSPPWTCRASLQGLPFWNTASDTLFVCEQGTWTAALSPGSLTLAGDVDGLASALDLDEAAVRDELESVLRLAQLVGSVTDAQVPNTITIDLATTATTANAGDSATAFFSAGAIEVARGGTGAAPGADDQVLVSSSTSAATWKTLVDTNNQGAVLQYDTATNAFSAGSAIGFFSSDEGTQSDIVWLDISGSGISCGLGSTTTCRVDAGVTAKLSAAIPCAVSASYCTIFTIPVTSTTAGVYLEASILIDTDSTSVAPQFRVRSADTGYTGICNWEIFDKAAATTTGPLYVNTAIAANPADTAGTTWGTTAPQWVNVTCALQADASPGDIIIEWQLETGTTPTQNVLAGSHYRIVNE